MFLETMSIYCKLYLDKIQEISIPNKYTKIYLAICNRAALRGKNRKTVKNKLNYVESHHIVPRSFGLINIKIKENLVHLTAREHFICHLLLTKMFEEKFKIGMIMAAWLMMCKNKNDGMVKINSTMY
jgi:hypothetical protein